MGEIVESRKQRLRACEKALLDHYEEFVKVGMALNEIREEKLYQEDGFKTFTEYCKQKWSFSDRHVRRLIDAANLRIQLPEIAAPNGEPDQLGPVHEPIPETVWNENHMRQLGRLESSKKAKAVAQKVVEEVKEAKAAGKKVKLGSIVKKHVDKALGPKPKPEEPEKPMFSEVVHGWTGKLRGITKLILEISEENLELFGRTEPGFVEGFADAIAGLQKAWEVPIQAAAKQRKRDGADSSNERM